MPMHMRLPKVGFRSKIKGDTAQVMLYQLDKLEGDIDFAVLRAAKLVPASAQQAKIVKKGEISKKLVLKGLLAPDGARAAIIAAVRTLDEPAHARRHSAPPPARPPVPATAGTEIRERG